MSFLCTNYNNQKVYIFDKKFSYFKHFTNPHQVIRQCNVLIDNNTDMLVNPCGIQSNIPFELISSKTSIFVKENSLIVLCMSNTSCFCCCCMLQCFPIPYPSYSQFALRKKSIVANNISYFCLDSLSFLLKGISINSVKTTRSKTQIST